MSDTSEKPIAFVVDGTIGTMAENEALRIDVIAMLEKKGYEVLGFPVPSHTGLTASGEIPALMDIFEKVAQKRLENFDSAQVCVFLLSGKPDIESTFLLGRASAGRASANPDQKVFAIWNDDMLKNGVVDIASAELYSAVIRFGRFVKDAAHLYETMPSADALFPAPETSAE